jgi:hypothetical protein
MERLADGKRAQYLIALIDGYRTRSIGCLVNAEIALPRRTSRIRIQRQPLVALAEDPRQALSLSVGDQQEVHAQFLSHLLGLILKRPASFPVVASGE